jgi:N-acetylglucosaminyldiphosphoundecaprenol N-acetyl-beta-D-mannosaminyltransferase
VSAVQTQAQTQPERVSLLGLPLDLVDLEGAVNILRGWVRDPARTRTVITLNPEIVVQSEMDAPLRESIQGADLVTADGVGIVWAVKQRLKRSVPGRTTGVDLALKLMELEGQNLRVYFLGARPGVAERAAQNSAQRFKIQVAGVRDGYFKPEELENIVREVHESKADLLLTALGAGRQETFNHTHRPARVSIGVGGTLDVLAGEVERAPEWTSKLGIEWVWRITTMRRWNRAWRLIEFALRVLRAGNDRHDGSSPLEPK